MKRDEVTVDVFADTAQFDQAMRNLTDSTRNFARVFSTALSGSVKSGKDLDDTLKGIARRLSDLALKSALKPLDNLLGDPGGALLADAASGISRIGSGSGFSVGNISPFARGGIINSPTLFNFGTRTGVMGEQGPEAIMPLSRGS